MLLVRGDLRRKMREKLQKEEEEERKKMREEGNEKRKEGSRFLMMSEGETSLSSKCSSFCSFIIFLPLSLLSWAFSPSPFVFSSSYFFLFLSPIPELISVSNNPSGSFSSFFFPSFKRYTQIPRNGRRKNSWVSEGKKDKMRKERKTGNSIS